MKPDPEQHPALHQLLTRPDGRTDADGRPLTCYGCPFGSLVEPPHEVANDPEEAHYDCSLIGRRAWGEEPACEVADWTRRAREELHLADGEPAARAPHDADKRLEPDRKRAALQALVDAWFAQRNCDVNDRHYADSLFEDADAALRPPIDPTAR